MEHIEGMIRAHDLTKVYHLGGQEVRALDNVNLELGDGEFLGLVGSSGSGKSTLLNLLAGMDTPDSGRIETPDGVLSEMSPGQLARYRRERVGMVFQIFHLIQHRTALQNVETALIFSGVPRGERRRRAREALERLGLGARLLHRPADLSGGEQQRVALARALVKNPSLLLADEPTGNLDQQNARQIGDLLEECNRRGITIVLVTHDEALAKRYARRNIRLRYGRISDGPLDEEGEAS